MNTFTPPPSSQFCRSVTKRLAAFAAALAVTVLAFPAAAQAPQCQEQWDQNCVNTGWHYGSSITCTNDPVTNGNFNSIRNYCWKGEAFPDNSNRRIYGATLRSFTGKGWYKPNGYNSWNFYPAYFKNGQIYIQARCRTGNMGTTMTWGKHPHTMSPETELARIVPYTDKQCPQP